jgi:hypothetical protein
MESKEIMTQNQSGLSLANWIAPASLEQALKLAEMMAKAKLLPDHLRGDPGSCLLVLEQASRWGMSPFAVGQCTSVVHGKLCFEGKLVAAALSAMKAIEGRLDYELSGTGLDRQVKVTGTPKGAKKTYELIGTVKQWRTTGANSPWEKSPDDMLIYRGTRQWARRHAPEAMLGVYTPDEMVNGMVDDIDSIPTTATKIEPTLKEKIAAKKAVEAKIPEVPQPSEAQIAVGNLGLEMVSRLEKEVGSPLSTWDDEKCALALDMASMLEAEGK